MLRSINELRDYVLAAEDGEIGRCRDFLFDDRTWTVRYMVADTGKWLPQRKVLISPASLGDPDWKTQLFRVMLTKSQIEGSPELETDAPVSRAYEREWYAHYNWSPYWYGGGIWGPGAIPQALADPPRETLEGDDTETDSHLRSAKEVTRYHIQAKDGEIGHVEDFIVDDETWTIRYVVVDTRNWLPGKKVLVAPGWASRIDWKDAKLHLDLEREIIKNGPEYDPSTPVNREYETRLYDYYGRPKYWN